MVLYPVVRVLGGSLKPGDEIVGSLEPLPTDPITGNYERLADGIAGIGIETFFVNSLLVALGSVAGVLISCSLAAYAFARIRFAGRNVLFALMIGTLLLPVHVLLGKFLAVDAFFVFLMVQFMRNLPRELDEAARIDGCGHWRIYWTIVLPLCRPALITSAIFSFICSWNDFPGPLIYLNEPDKYTVPLGLKMFMDQDSLADYGGMIATSVAALLPVLLFFLAFRRHLVEGAAASGLKG